MKAITVRQPWAWAIIYGGKDVENRGRNIAGIYRGPVAIHAGLQYDYAGARDTRIGAAFLAHLQAGGWWPSDTVAWFDAAERDGIAPDMFRFGEVIGLANLVNVGDHTSGPSSCCASKWADPGEHHLMLRGATPIPTPIPARGALGLWTLPDDVSAQLEGACR